MDEYGNPIYGEAWNPETDRAAIVDLETMQPAKGLWGEYTQEDSEDEDEDVGQVPVPQPVPEPQAPTTAPFYAPTQFNSGVPVDLRTISNAPDASSAGSLYRVLTQKSAPTQPGALFPSRNIYELNPTDEVTGGIATATGIAQRAHEVEDENVITTEMIREQLDEHAAAAAKTGVEAKKPAKKKAKFKF
jgi:hypothetical protein